MEKIIALIDMDCFYVQVEQRADPQYWGKPCVVAQYNPWRGGGLIAVNYEARAAGVKRGTRGDDAKVKCPDLHLFMVEEDRGKAKLTKYRNASVEVMNVITNFNPQIIVQRASIDEAFLDLTSYVESIAVKPSLDDVEGTHVVGLPDDERFQGKDKQESQAKKLRYFYDQVDERSDEENLLIGAAVIKRIREAVYKQTQFRCSAGISHNKILSKLAAGMNKPNAQTILPFSTVPKVFETTPIDKIRNLGGKFGDELQAKFKINTMGQLAALPEERLALLYSGKTLNWLKAIRQGIDDDPVIARQIPKSIGCGKNFPGVGKSALMSGEQINFWIGQLCGELVDRLTEDQECNKRVAKLLTVHIKFNSRGDTSRSLPLYDVDRSKLVDYILKHVMSKFIQENGSLVDPIVMLSVAASKFVDADLCWKNSKLDSYFTKVNQPSTSKQANNSATDTSTASASIVVDKHSTDTPSVTVTVGTNKTKADSASHDTSTESNGGAKGISNLFNNYYSKKALIMRSDEADSERENSSDSTLLAMFGRMTNQSTESHHEAVSVDCGKRRGFFYRKSLELAKKRQLNQN